MSVYVRTVLLDQASFPQWSTSFLWEVHKLERKADCSSETAIQRTHVGEMIDTLIPALISTHIYLIKGSGRLQYCHVSTPQIRTG